MNKTQRTKLAFWQEMSFEKSCVEQSMSWLLEDWLQQSTPGVVPHGQLL